MLKPPNEPAAPPSGDEERPVGELVHELIDDGKAYARAEMELVKSIASAKASALKVPAILLAGAVVILQAAINALAVGVALALTPVIGPLGGALVAFLLFAGLSGGLAWLGVRKLRDNL